MSVEIRIAEKLRNWLLEEWPHSHILTATVVRRGPNSLRNSITVKAAFKLLEEHGWLMKNDEGTILADETGHEAARKLSWKIVRS